MCTSDVARNETGITTVMVTVMIMTYLSLSK